MPKVTLEFQLPEESEQFEITSKASHLDYVIQELDNYLRSKIKYGTGLTDEQYAIYSELREKLWELKNE